MKKSALSYQTLRNKSVTIDCNVLLLLVIGSIERNQIEKFKRTAMFSPSDYDLLIDLIKDSTIVLTPNILTEASNLLESNKSSQVDESLQALKRLISDVKEEYLTSLELSQNNCFVKFGLSDSSIYELCKKGTVAITVDNPLYAFLLNKGYPVVNFNHVINEN